MVIELNPFKCLIKRINVDTVVLAALIAIHVSSMSWAEYFERQAPLPTGNTYTAVWGSSESDVYAVGQYGTIVHYDGNAWSVVSEELIHTFLCVWGSSKDDVYVGGYGTLLHYNGTTWTYTGIQHEVTSIWGASSDNIYAVCRRGNILHFDGAIWTEMESPVSDLTMNDSSLDYVLKRIWGSSPDDIYAVGDNGIIIHFDGSHWSRIGCDCTSDLYCVWGKSASEVYISGYECPLLKFDGTNWTIVDAPVDFGFHGMHGDPVNGLVCSDRNQVYTYDNGEWELEPTEDIYFSPEFNACWSSENGDIFAVGYGGSIFHFDGTDWHSMTNIPPSTLKDIYAVSSADVYAVGIGTIVHYDGQNWSQVQNNHHVYSGIWGSAGDDVYAVGLFSLFHYDGENWVEMGDESTYGLNSVWGTSWDNVYFVGGNGKILHYDGESLTELETLTINHLNDIWGQSENDIYIAGDDSTLFHYDGHAWNQIDIMNHLDFDYLWGTASDDIYVLGRNPYQEIFQYQGQGWEYIDLGDVDDSIFLGVAYSHVIWGTSRDNLYFAGSNVFHYDGSYLSYYSCNGYNNFHGMSGTEDGHVFVAGSGGGIFQLTSKILPRISLDIPESINESQAGVPVRCSVIAENAPDSDLILNVQYLYGFREPEDIIYPKIVVIQAGQTSGSFDIEVVDNDSRNFDRNFTLKAVGYGWDSVERTIDIIDDDRMEASNDSDDDHSCFITCVKIR